MDQELPRPAPLDAITLRAVSEVASSLREGRRWIVVRGRADIRVVDADPGRPDGAVVIPVETPPVGSRPAIARAVIGAKIDGVMRKVKLLEVPDPVDPKKTHRADAVFWSEAAVEKFLLPYYASKHLHEGGRKAQEIVDLFHRPRADGDAPGEPRDGDVIALVHVPTSEYVPVAEAAPVPTPEMFAATVRRNAAGELGVEVVSVDALLAERRARPG